MRRNIKSSDSPLLFKNDKVITGKGSRAKKIVVQGSIDGADDHMDTSASENIPWVRKPGCARRNKSYLVKNTEWIAENNHQNVHTKSTNTHGWVSCNNKLCFVVSNNNENNGTVKFSMACGE